MAIYLGNLKVNMMAGTTDGGSSGATVEPLSVTSNGTYSAPTGTAYSPVTVSVPTLSTSAITLTENGVYSAPTGYAYSQVTASIPTVSVTSLTVSNNGTYQAPTGYAYSPVTVSVSGGGSADYLETRAAMTSYSSTVSSIPAFAFAGMSSLTTVSLPNITSVPSGAFMSCSKLTTINASGIKSIYSSAFYHCDKLAYASFPECIYLGTGAFTNCSSTSYASFPKYSGILSGFSFCYKLENFYAPSATSIATYCFYQCSKLSSVDIKSCNTLSTYAFYNCSSLSEIDLPHLYRPIGSQAFYSCRALHTVKIGSSVTSTSTSHIIYPAAFLYCFNLLSLYLYGSQMWTLSNATVFNSTPISTYTTSTGGVNGSIFVPASLVDTYKSATNWVTYSARITSIPAEVVL